MAVRWLFPLIALLLAYPGAIAEPAPKADQERQAEPRERTRSADSRKLLEEVLMARLTKELALDEGQSVILVRHLAEYREQMAALRRERAQLIRVLRDAVRESKEESRIAELLAQVNAQDEKIASARAEFQAFSSLDLTTWQRARLYLFVQDFENDMRRLLKRAQERRNATGSARETPGSGGEKRRAGVKTNEKAKVNSSAASPTAAPAP